MEHCMRAPKKGLLGIATSEPIAHHVMRAEALWLPASSQQLLAACEARPPLP